jgi:acetyl-CoA carboxylase biotin carboxylase subunit
MYEGWTVPIDYDPLLAKLIGYGTDRTQAISRLTRALHEYFVGGIKSNISLFRRILTDTDFQAGKLDTGYLDRLLKSKPPELAGGHPEVAAIAGGIFAILDSASALASNGNASASPGNRAGEGMTASGWKRAARAEVLR